MNQKALKVLEYDKIIQLLAEQATSDAGKKRCLELVPMTDKQLITDAQAQTADALSRIYRKGNISFGGLKDPGFQMKRLEIGGCLNAAELLSICTLLEITRRAKAYSRENRDDLPADSLDVLFAGHRCLRKSAAAFWQRMRSVTMPARHFTVSAAPSVILMIKSMVP